MIILEPMPPDRRPVFSYAVLFEIQNFSKFMLLVSKGKNLNRNNQVMNKFQSRRIKILFLSSAA